ncbi:hypothetical protein ANN_11745 [Periplaneta americana]|uniref:Uncharacterized protein n=1 Tax=Periplaneta americana TaxID=6978 RepID=A0ABQ8T856_PERAM|nr:hypothetical protein ANN_11745 [Periplaneta americana]
MADTSNYSLEVRLVGSVWVHERQHTKQTMQQIMTQFEKRFGRSSPIKATVLAWDRRAFITDSVEDSPRSGPLVVRLDCSCWSY